MGVARFFIRRGPIVVSAAVETLCLNFGPMPPLPFQYMPVRAWADVPLWFLGMGLLFGIPTLGLVFVLARFGPLKRARLRTIVLLLPLMGLLFGAVTGYFNVWDDHHYWLNRAPEKQEWYEIFTVFGWPGDAMANSYGGDWQADEAWDYRGDIVTWNTLFWTSVAVGGIFVVRFSRRLKWHRPGSTVLPAATEPST